MQSPAETRRAERHQPGGVPAEDRLRKLRVLRDSGSISAAEYTRERAKILREL